MKKLNAGAKWIFRMRSYFSLAILSFFLFYSFSGGFLLLSIFKNNLGLLKAIPYFIFINILGIIIVGEIYAKMAYNRWMYEFTPTNFKKESGIIWKRYSNIPYGRVQNVDITRGILARFFGFSTVMIQTAGYSYGGRYGTMSEGYIPAVSPEEAEHIRDFLMKKAHGNSSRHQGI